MGNKMTEIRRVTKPILFNFMLKIKRRAAILNISNLVVIGSLFCFSLACASNQESGKYGIQGDALAYIPARIAVLNCRLWPYKIAYEKFILSNAPSEISTQLCKKLDKSVIDAFEGQPYMRGLSPNVVDKLIERSNSQGILQQIDEIWLPNDPNSVKTCSDPVQCYKTVVANQEDWRIWLQNFSSKVANADALLLPMLTYVTSGRVNDRGLANAYRQVGLVILLIDTKNGNLIWAGGRQAEARNQKSLQEIKLESLALPSWGELEGRLFVNDIFADFPGRQNY